MTANASRRATLSHWGAERSDPKTIVGTGLFGVLVSVGATHGPTFKRRLYSGATVFRADASWARDPGRSAI